MCGSSAALALSVSSDQYAHRRDPRGGAMPEKPAPDGPEPAPEGPRARQAQAAPSPAREGGSPRSRPPQSTAFICLRPGWEPDVSSASPSSESGDQEDSFVKELCPRAWPGPSGLTQAATSQLRALWVEGGSDVRPSPQTLFWSVLYLYPGAALSFLGPNSSLFRTMGNRQDAGLRSRANSRRGAAFPSHPPVTVNINKHTGHHTP